MDALSALSSISASNAVASLTSPVAATRAQPASTTSEPSVTTIFSDLALTLLKQQASDPSQDIDNAFATSLLNRSLGNSGQLYTATGVLQQFASATSGLASAENQGASNQVSGNLNSPAIDANQVLTDLINSFRQPALTDASAQQTIGQEAFVAAANGSATTAARAISASQSLLTSTAQNEQTSLINQLAALSAQNTFAPQAARYAAIDPVVVPPDLAASLDQFPPSFDTSRLTATTTVGSRPIDRTENEPSSVDLTTVGGNAITQLQITAEDVDQPVDSAEQLDAQDGTPAQSGGTDTAAMLAQPDFEYFNNDDQVPFGMDVYQMAALASGFSSFGKELNTFVPASGDNITQGAVGQVNAIAPVMRIGARADETTEA